MIRRSLKLMLISTSVAAAQLAGAAQAADACDPNRPIIDRAIKLRNAGQSSTAETLLRGLIAKDPNDLGANYILATLELNRGRKDADDGLARLVMAEKLLPTHSEQCKKALGWYSIYNTLGAQYYRRKDLAKSETYLLQGYAHLNAMFDSTKRLLLSNLGLLYFSKGDLDKSLSFYQQAARAGSQDAPQRIAIIRRIERR